MYADEDGIILIKSYHFNKLVKKNLNIVFFLLAQYFKGILRSGGIKERM